MDNLSSSITVEIKINKPVDYVWQLWTTPADIEHWNIPFDDWHSPKVENDLKPGGNFSIVWRQKMAAKVLTTMAIMIKL